MRMRGTLSIEPVGFFHFFFFFHHHHQQQQGWGGKPVLFRDWKNCRYFSNTMTFVKHKKKKNETSDYQAFIRADPFKRRIVHDQEY